MNLVLFVIGVLLLLSAGRAYYEYKQCDSEGRKRDFFKQNLLIHSYGLLVASLSGAVFIIVYAILKEMGL